MPDPKRQTLARPPSRGDSVMDLIDEVDPGKRRGRPSGSSAVGVQALAKELSATAAAQILRITALDAEALIVDLCGIMADHFVRGESVYLRDVGTFRCSTRPAGTTHHPKTGEVCEKPGYRIVRWRSSKLLRKALQDLQEAKDKWTTEERRGEERWAKWRETAELKKARAQLPVPSYRRREGTEPEQTGTAGAAEKAVIEGFFSKG